MPALSTHALLILVGAGLLGGAGNAAAGGGSLVTFPVLIGLGLPPITANVTNTLGHAPGYVAIVAGLREELTGQRRRVGMLTPLAAAGAAGEQMVTGLQTEKSDGDVGSYGDTARLSG